MEIGRDLTEAQINRISYEISNIVSQIKFRQIQGRAIDLKSIEQGYINQIRANGGNPNDPAWMHLLLDALGPVIKSLQGGTKGVLNDVFNGHVDSAFNRVDNGVKSFDSDLRDFIFNKFGTGIKYK